MRALIVGGGTVGDALAEELADAGVDVVYLDEDERAVERARDRGLTARAVDVQAVSSWRHHGVDPEFAVVATDRDSTNLLVAKLLHATFDVDDVVVRLNDPQNRESFEAADLDVVCATTALVDALESRLSGPREDRPSDRRNVHRTNA